MQMITGYTNRERPKGDFYATPEIAIRRLLDVEAFGKRVLEPCCGNGAISSVLTRCGFDVESRDLYDWGYGRQGIDFLEPATNFEQFDAVITNPPFRLFQQFAERALEHASEGKVALLGRIQALEGAKRRSLFTKGKLSRVWVFSKRLPRMHRFDYVGKGATSMVAFAWFVWDAQKTGEPTLAWL
jgi:hypothetical protein